MISSILLFALKGFATLTGIILTLYIAGSIFCRLAKLGKDNRFWVPFGDEAVFRCVFGFMFLGIITCVLFLLSGFGYLVTKLSHLTIP